MKSIFKPAKPFKLIPLNKPNNTTFERFSKSKRYKIPSYREKRIIEKDDAPSCNLEQMQNYRENWDDILLPKVTKELKKTDDIMHGSYSVNMQVTKPYRREAHDIDVWAKKPKAMATRIENAIDKCVGCDIAQVKVQKIGKSPSRKQALGPPGKSDVPKDYFTRYTVITQPENDVDVDFSTIPDDRPLKTRTLRGIRHETLDSALERAYDIQDIPYRAARAKEDIKRIEGYKTSTKRRK